jgi:hypothetical protein
VTLQQRWIVAEEIERDDRRDVQTRHRAPHIQVEELAVHRLERYVVPLNDPTDLPRPDQAGHDRSQHDPQAPWLAVKDATVLLRQRHQRERVAMVFERRRAYGAHPFQGSRVVTPRGLFDHELVLRPLRQNAWRRGDSHQ